jgi:hypothetical protein
MGSVRISGMKDRGTGHESLAIHDPKSATGAPWRRAVHKQRSPPKQGRTFPAFGKRKNIHLFICQVKKESIPAPDRFLCCRPCLSRARPETERNGHKSRSLADREPNGASEPAFRPPAFVITCLACRHYAPYWDRNAHPIRAWTTLFSGNREKLCNTRLPSASIVVKTPRSLDRGKSEECGLLDGLCPL